MERRKMKGNEKGDGIKRGEEGRATRREGMRQA